MLGTWTFLVVGRIGAAGESAAGRAARHPGATCRQITITSDRGALEASARTASTPSAPVGANDDGRRAVPLARRSSGDHSGGVDDKDRRRETNDPQSHRSQDPDPALTGGLEPGGGVAPGDTPPDAGVTSGLSAPEPKLPSMRTNAVIGIAIAVLFAAAILAFFVARL